MVTAIESAWQRIKDAAQDCAKRGTKLNERDAEGFVVRFLREAHVSPWPSVDVIEFYTVEMLEMIERDRMKVQ